MPGEWVEWHRGYAEGQPLTRRLRAVQRSIRTFLDSRAPGPIGVLSLCAGDGRDLLGVLSDHPRRDDVRARLIDQDPDLVAEGRRAIARIGLEGVEFVEGDAASARTCSGAVPADLVLACGIFGNVSDGNIHDFIGHLPELCAPGAHVIWTRSRVAPDLTPTIRRWFQESGFAEESFTEIPESLMSVGAHRLVVAPREFQPDVHFFTFLPPQDRPSRRGAAGHSAGTAEGR